MKALANGALNLSTLDGWWDEAWHDATAEKRFIGWAIGRGESYDNAEYQDQVESAALYELLEHDIVPAFYERGAGRPAPPLDGPDEKLHLDPLSDIQYAAHGQRVCRGFLPDGQ